MDLSVNKPFKDHLRSQFTAWYSYHVAKELSSGNEPEDFKTDTRLSVMKGTRSEVADICICDHVRKNQAFVKKYEL